MKQLAFKIGMGYVRHALTTGGGALVAKGVMTNDNVTTIVGGIITALSVVWSHFSKLPVPQDTTN